MTTFPTPPEPEPTVYLKPSELVGQTPPLIFEILRVGEGDTQFGPKWYVNVAGPDDGDYCIAWKQGDDAARDQLLLPLVRDTEAKRLQAGILFSLYRTGPGGKVITLGPPLDGGVLYAQSQLAATEAAAQPAAAAAQPAAAAADGEDIPF